jgi:3-dehydroquinate dehydratase II
MKTMRPILVLNGPNLNLLGIREPETYGRATLKDLEKLCKKTAAALHVSVDCRHSNIEGEIVTWIQGSRKTHSGIIINAGGYTHTSVAILDALLLSKLPAIEVHVTNIYAREKFRQHSLLSTAVKGVICGLGIDGYALAMQALVQMSSKTRQR